MAEVVYVTRKIDKARELANDLRIQKRSTSLVRNSTRKILEGTRSNTSRCNLRTREGKIVRWSGENLNLNEVYTQDDEIDLVPTGFQLKCDELTTFAI